MLHVSLTPPGAPSPPTPLTPKVSPQYVRERVMGPRRRLIKLSSVAWCASVTGRAARGLPHDSQQLHQTLPGLEKGWRSQNPALDPGHNTTFTAKKKKKGKRSSLISNLVWLSFGSLWEETSSFCLVKVSLLWWRWSELLEHHLKLLLKMWNHLTQDTYCICKFSSPSVWYYVQDIFLD